MFGLTAEIAGEGDSVSHYLTMRTPVLPEWCIMVVLGLLTQQVGFLL